MALILHNNLSKKEEEFKPQRDDYVTLYTCGPTVYDHAHIGNFRAYIFTDILKRTLMYNNYKVKHIMNITDIDDKTIRDSIKNNQSLKEFTEFYTEGFYKDRDLLHILPADRYTKATDYIKEMLVIVDTLIKKNYAYIEADGSVYFDVAKNKNYGQLVDIDIDALKENAKGRIKKDEYEKDTPQDFALWKAWDSEDGDVKWDPKEYLGNNTTIGIGRPGWHIECSAMSMATLGESIDIHTGGLDNMFPHHENEIAQSECATGKKFVHYWLHNGWLLVEGKKMSKSLGNFYQLADLKKEGFDLLAYRYLVLQTHYRAPFNFSLTSLSASEKTIKKIFDFVRKTKGEGFLIESYKILFLEALNEDLNTSKAIGILWNMMNDTQYTDTDKKATLFDFDKVLGLELENIKEIEIPKEVIEIMKERENARNQKDWAKADELRTAIKKLGFEVKDTENGQEVI